jgi:hypothetical protein
MIQIWDTEGHLAEFPREVVRGYNYAVDGTAFFFRKVGRGLLDLASGRLFSNISLPWTPEDIATAAWYDAFDSDTITESGGAVSQWDDKSGNGRHLTQGTGTKQPTTNSRTINSLNCIDFDGGDKVVCDLATAWQDSQFLAIGVFIMDTDTGAYGRVLSNWQDGQASDHNNDPSFTMSKNFANEAFEVRRNVLPSAQSVTYGSAFMGGCMQDATKFYAHLNGVLSAGISKSGAIDVDNITLGGYLDNATTSNYWNGAIGEVIYYGASDTTNRQLIEGYLAWKWSGAL